MPTIADLMPLLSEPREDLGAEYKGWLDLTQNEHKALVAKAAIALANHGGGYIIIGMAENGGTFTSEPRPDSIPEVTQDSVNAAVRRFATPEFHCEVYAVPHADTNIDHVVVAVPGGMTEPVMSRRDCPGVIAQNRCYIRKPGPRSEEPGSQAEWRTLLDRCLRAGREDMLDAIRAIVTGRVDARLVEPDATELLQTFCEQSTERWNSLVEQEPISSPSRFPHGHYELGFKLIGAEPASTMVELRSRLSVARQIRHTGWTPFLEMTTPEWAPYINNDVIEAWVGRPARENWQDRDPSLCDFWRASTAGELFTMRGYSEDGRDATVPGTALDVTLPVWRVGEAIFFAARLADTFEGVSAIAIRCAFTGLDGRALVSLTGRRAMFGDRISRTDSIVVTAQPTPEQIRDNLAEILRPLLAPLYERFDFFELPATLIGEELARMRENRL
ncbi:MAG: putative DNA binding domain-containing protein [Sphingopyxis sp.]|nr:putative DNA binding domain-containing protein [Sphingopyxis sp.]